MSDHLTLVPDRWHVSYTEPNGWTSSLRCRATRTDAESTRDAINALSGADARRRRTWTISECTCGAV